MQRNYRQITPTHTTRQTALDRGVEYNGSMPVLLEAYATSGCMTVQTAQNPASKRRKWQVSGGKILPPDFRPKPMISIVKYPKKKPFI